MTALARLSWLAPATLMVAIAGTGGCSRPPAPLVSVTGRVTFAGESPPDACRVFFAPVFSTAPGGKPMRPATADCAPDGTFSAVSFNVHHGLRPGRYEARVTCWKVPPSASNPLGVSHVPADWTPPVIDVPEGSDGIQLAIALPGSASDRSAPSPRASKAQGPADPSDYHQLLHKEPSPNP